MSLLKRIKFLLRFYLEHPLMLPFLLKLSLIYPSLPYEILKTASKRSLRGAQYISTLHAYHVKSHLHQAKKQFNKLYLDPSSIKLETLKRLNFKKRHLLKDCYFWDLLYILCRLAKPKVVVETGVAQGGSSACILKALEDNGEGFLYSIDLPENIYIRDDKKLQVDIRLMGFEPGHAVPKGLRKRWKFILGSSEEKLPTLLKKIGGIDIFIHDSEHIYKNMMFEYTLAWEYLRPGGILISDDVDWSLAFDDFCRAKKIKSYSIREIGVCMKE